jgi:hypothetical protein
MDNKFVKDPNSDAVIFTGEELIAYIPERYGIYTLLSIDEYVSALGIFDLSIDGKKAGIMIPAVLVMDPSELDVKIINGDTYKVCTFKHGDRFLVNSFVVQLNKMGYYIWKEFLSNGKIPSFITYDVIFGLLDDLKEVSGTGIDASHAVFEIVYQHLYRDPDDLSKLYRLTPMTKQARVINMMDISNTALSTHSRVFGAYSADGINAALAEDKHENNDFEDMYRQ